MFMSNGQVKLTQDQELSTNQNGARNIAIYLNSVTSFLRLWIVSKNFIHICDAFYYITGMLGWCVGFQSRIPPSRLWFWAEFKTLFRGLLVNSGFQSTKHITFAELRTCL